jgi:hypothetical protein
MITKSPDRGLGRLLQRNFGGACLQGSKIVCRIQCQPRSKGIALVVSDVRERGEAGSRGRSVGGALPIVDGQSKGPAARGKPADDVAVHARRKRVTTHPGPPRSSKYG